jgi:uncharacterized membrane protein
MGIEFLPSAAAAFLASFVEFVEALTVILALGATRGWRWPLLGTGAALVVLAGIAAVFGPALQALNTPWLRLGVGLLVLLFGLRWLRKAILRAAGALPLHDEVQAFAQARARYTEAPLREGWDAIAFAGGFQVTLMEGSEVAFIVIAMGAGRAGVAPPAFGAAVALVAVIGLGLALHRPLSRIPENALKCAVGILLTAFGTFWTGEGIGVVWPGGDAGLVLLSLFWAVIALAFIALLSRSRRVRGAPP